MTITRNFFRSIKNSIDYKLIVIRNRILIMADPRLEIALVKIWINLLTFSFKS